MLEGNDIKGQILKALSGFYYIKCGEIIYQTRARGNFRAKNLTPLVGDLVEFEASNEKEGVILKLLPRKNSLVRPPICNIDAAVIVMSSIQPNFSQNLLDRYIVILEQMAIEPIIYISKCDLECSQDLMDTLQYYRELGYSVLLSNDKDVINQLKDRLYQKVSVLMGQSGSGKSTLLNNLLPHLNLRTAEISNYLNRGKHTTRHVEIHDVNGCYIADTPGFSAIDLSNIAISNLSALFVDIHEKAQHCRFRGCLHMNEPECAVKTYSEQNVQFNRRYNQYKQFYEEINQQRPIYQKNRKK